MDTLAFNAGYFGSIIVFACMVAIPVLITIILYKKATTKVITTPSERGDKNGYNPNK